MDGQSRVRLLEDRVEPAGLKLMSFLRYWGCEVWREIVNKEDDFVVDALSYFKPVQRFELELLIQTLTLMIVNSYVKCIRVTLRSASGTEHAGSV